MRYRTLTLLLTYNCNLACDYCFCGKKRKDSMSEEMSRKAIDFFMKRSNEKVNIVFFGGEPLLESDLIEKIILYCEEKYNNRVNYLLTTNGTLLNKCNVDMIRKWNIGITLSIDGKADSHDLHRCFRDGRPSWDIIMKNIEDSNLEKDLLTVRLTFTKNNVAKLADNVISLHKLGFKNLAFYPASDSKDMYTEDDINCFRKQIDKLVEYTYLCYQENNPIKIHWINRSIKSHINGGCLKCMDGINQMAITPDGYIYPCNRVDFSDMNLCLGNINDGIDSKKILWYRQEIEKGDPECSGCWLKNRCHGCHMENYSVTGKVWEIPLYYCLMNQYVIQKSDEMANKLYKEKNQYFIGRYYSSN